MKRSVCIGHPCVGRGGSEARAMWLLHTLKDDFDVTLVTTRYVDLDDLNQFYGTAIQQDEVHVRTVSVPVGMRNNCSFAALRRAYYMRFTRQIGKEYDLCISAYNISDWGGPGLHFIADFGWDRDLSCKFDPVPNDASSMIHRDNLLRRCYLLVCRLISGKRCSHQSFFDGTQTIIANSNWSAEIICDRYGYICDGIVYPPVLAECSKKPWKDKTVGFVSIGRIAREKRVEQQIEILGKVRALGHEIHFHLIGEIENNPYGQMVRQLCANKNWITLEGRKSGAGKEDLLAGHRFAIHTRPHEAFGITVAEFVQAGCIPFVPDTGGQTEIVPFKELQFCSIAEAVKKIDGMLQDESIQKQALQKLEGQKDKFSVEHFCQMARSLVEDYFEEHQQGSKVKL